MMTDSMRNYYADRERREREAAARSASAKVRDIHLDLAERYARLARPRVETSKQSLQQDAAECRRMAEDLSGRPEESFLLKVASTMEELALIRQ